MDLLQSVIEKANSGEVFSLEKASELAKLYDYDIFALGEAADSIRSKLYGKKVFFNINRHINPSNICADSCKFCAFSASRKNKNPYSMDIDSIISQAIASYNNGAKEVHIVSAHNPNYTFSWYMDLFRKLKNALPNIHLKALTAAEVDYIYRISNKSYKEILESMIENGVDSMPGGGAEIFNKEIREYICKGKLSGEQWLEIHRIWHSLGKMSNATMLFGHVENRVHRLEHILLLSNSQSSKEQVDSKSGGFNAFIPLLYQKENNFLKVSSFPSGQEILKTISIARLIAHNIPHIKAYWATLGLNVALVAQEFGADDMDGTIEAESIQSAAGAKSKSGADKNLLISQIKNAGFRAIERDSLYNELKEW